MWRQSWWKSLARGHRSNFSLCVAKKTISHCQNHRVSLLKIPSDGDVFRVKPFSFIFGQPPVDFYWAACQEGGWIWEPAAELAHSEEAMLLFEDVAIVSVELIPRLIRSKHENKKSVYLGQGLALLLWLSQLPQAILSNPGIDRGSLCVPFPVLKSLRWVRARETRGREARKDSRACAMAALPGQFQGQCCSTCEGKKGRMKAKGKPEVSRVQNVLHLDPISNLWWESGNHHKMASLARCRQFCCCC